MRMAPRPTCRATKPALGPTNPPITDHERKSEPRHMGVYCGVPQAHVKDKGHTAVSRMAAATGQQPAGHGYGSVAGAETIRTVT